MPRISTVDPTTNATGDVLTETKVGVAAGRWKRWRAQVQVGYRTAPDVLPVSLVGFDEPDPTAQRSAMLQLGAAF